MRATFLLLIFSFCLYPMIKAQTIYVDSSNNTGNEDGTLEHPYNTIKEGINAASIGYQLMIKTGTYIPDDSWSGNDHTLFLKAGIKLIGEGTDKTIIQGIVVDQENSNLSIGLEKLRFDEFYFTRGTHAGPFVDMNIIKDCSTDYIDLPFGAGIPSNDTTPGPNYGFLIENNDLGTEGIIDFKQGAGISNLTVKNNSCGYIYLKSGGGYTYLIDNNDIQYSIADKSATNTTTISNNRIANGGIDDKSGGNQYGVEDEIIENNTITADENSPAFIDEDYKAGIQAKSRSVTIRNNTITCTGNVSGIRSSAGAPMHILNNTITLSEVQSPAPDPYESTSGIFNYSGWGKVSGNKITGGNMGYYSKAGTVEFSNNTIINAFTGFYSIGAEKVHHNSISNCKANGLILDGIRGPVFSNMITNNGGSGILVMRAPVDLGSGTDSCPGLNVITGNGNYDLYIMANSSTYPVINARYNVWDHMDTLEIMQQDIRDGNDSTGLVRVDFTPCSGLGVPESEGNTHVEIFPNPASDFCNVSLYTGSVDQFCITILNIFQQKAGIVLEKNCYPGLNEIPINLTSLISGIYLCRIQSKSFCETKLLVIQY